MLKQGRSVDCYKKYYTDEAIGCGERIVKALTLESIERSLNEHGVHGGFMDIYRGVHKC